MKFGVGNIKISAISNWQLAAGRSLPEESCQFQNLVKTTRDLCKGVNASRKLPIASCIIQNYKMEPPKV